MAYRLLPASGAPPICGDKTVYFAGDTGLFGDMKLIGELYHPYLAVLPAGDKYVMGMRECAWAAKLIGAPVMVPGHYDTFPAIRCDTEALRRCCSAEAPDTQVVILKPGETFQF